MTTSATPTRFISSASAARGERSRMRPRVYGSPIVDFNDDGVAVAEVGHLCVRGEWKRPMRCRSGNGVKDLATGGPPAHKVVPSSFPNQSGSSRAPPAAPGLWDAIAPICCALETWEPLLCYLGSYSRRT